MAGFNQLTCEKKAGDYWRCEAAVLVVAGIGKSMMV
jgi:hypothetical protein